ncbi:hypothetical protein L1987_61395 [Smallanthus sonchifolius]|uniref:Uncharacterized protein n=1 Tax=Smallanthus sonchifolius TaxID=185202 RepID=A0ACB9C7I0_9ASTR|nr:hypothetical protein L1987_61395 [Smallanthus sonchifolius]
MGKLMKGVKPVKPVMILKMRIRMGLKVKPRASPFAIAKNHTSLIPIANSNLTSIIRATEKKKIRMRI